MKWTKASFCNIPFVRLLFVIILCVFQCLISGCSMIGPISISQGRLSYAEAINRTEDEQILLAIVKDRYRETATLLGVNSIAANMRFRANVDAEVGFGDDEDYLGNLVPFSAGVAYEENPTITYQPIKGEQYFRQLMSPIPLDILLITLRSETHSGSLITILVNRVNNLRNPDFLEIASHEPNLRFKRFAELYAKLNSLGVIELVKNPQTDVTFDLLISDYTPAYSANVTEFLELLNLPRPTDESQDIVIPISFAVKAKESKSIGVITRSTYDLFEIMTASIAVPQEHIDSGLTRVYPPMGLPGQKVRILSSKTRPNNMSLAVKYREYWFYIDETDQDTKNFFVLTRALWSFISTVSDAQSSAPVLTIPVSR